VALAVGLWLFAPAPAGAALTLIGEFLQTTGAPFQFTFTGPGASFSATTPVTFHYRKLSGVPTGEIAANLILTSTTTTGASNLGGTLVQPVNGVVNTLQILRAIDNANLITATFNGSISGFAGDVNATLNASTSIGNTVTFSSAFVPFGATTSRAFQVVLPTVNPSLSIAGNGFLANFSSDAFGAFTVDPVPVPEPSSYLYLGGGLVVTALAALRTRARRRDGPVPGATRAC
jgi:hypothetical protein